MVYLKHLMKLLSQNKPHQVGEWWRRELLVSACSRSASLMVLRALRRRCCCGRTAGIGVTGAGGHACVQRRPQCPLGGLTLTSLGPGLSTI